MVCYGNTFHIWPDKVLQGAVESSRGG
jgi:hypothetical protein